MELHVGRPKQDPHPLRGVDSQRFADQAASARDLVKLVRALGSAGRSGGEGEPELEVNKWLGTTLAGIS